MTGEPTAEERWRETWSLVGAPAPLEPLANTVARYAEPHRAYHDLTHILECLGHASAVRPLLRDVGSVELAIWFHDVIYDPRAGDNEERSASFAKTAIGGAASMAVLETVQRLILATKHPSRPTEHDAQYVVDIDLAILGAPPERYDEYESAIRREYGWVPRPIYRRKRRQVLQSFLDLDGIYLTPHFKARLEAQARTNLEAALSRL